ncbi:ArsR/SmtB family transcription factor [Oceanivirga salmonicida]|uniref:ArsR/SmtB family transcription factor n=1 Tax=Oceanivirga salmonicida TaxID=1769291 RepID=UPI0012E1E343|nr:metalloregulator ArsR/SmtB family transcription factor [Oceanivirga salmonicida]
MKKSPNIEIISKILSDKSRLQILDLLLNGKSYRISELNELLKIKQHTISYHMKLLIDSNIINYRKYGKYKYFYINNTHIAFIMELLSNYSPKDKIKNFNDFNLHKDLYYARTCYDHIAGKIGVELTDYFIKNNYISFLDNNFYITKKGENFFKLKFNINMLNLKKYKRKICFNCLDWSERKFHIAGSLGKSILEFFLNNNYLVQSNISRALSITDTGLKFFLDEFNLDFSDYLNRYKK